MNKAFVLITSCALMLLGQMIYGQNDSVIDEIIRIGKTDNQTMKHLDVLTNRFGGRLTGSAAYDNAAEWVAYMFKSWGMEVEMDLAGELPVGFNRGPWFGRMLSDKGMQLHFATPSYTSGTKGVQRGHVLLEPYTQGDFNKIKARLKGAWVLIGGTNNGRPIDYSHEANQRRDSIIAKNEHALKQNEKIKEKNRSSNSKMSLIPLNKEPALFYKQMVEAGILGIIQSSPVPIRAMVDKVNIKNMTFETLPDVPDIKLDEYQYEVIKNMVTERHWFQLEFDIRNHFKMGPIGYHNVIGKIPGTEFPDEYVIMSAHLDSYDIATGAIDNGSGVTPMMEAARLIMKAGGKPKRTILFCLWAGEEFGLWGSTSWVKRNKDKSDRISFVINRDDASWIPVSINVTKSMWADMEKVCKPIMGINEEFPFHLIEHIPELPEKARGSDHVPFAHVGVPAVNMGTSDHHGHDFDYREIWHTERDLYQKNIPEYQEYSSIVKAVIAYGIANLDHLLPREGFYLKSEVKKKRE